MHDTRYSTDIQLADRIARITESTDDAIAFGTFAAERGWSLSATMKRLQDAGVSLTDLNDGTIGAIARAHFEASMDRPETPPSTDRVAREILHAIALHQVTWSETGTSDLDGMLTVVMAIIATEMKCHACSIFFHDPYQQTLMLRATYGLNPRAVGKVVIRADAGITGLAASTREIQAAEISAQHPAFLSYPNVGEEGYTSQLSVPIIISETDQLIGVLNLQTRERHRFTDDEVAFIDAVADDLAIAIQSARVHSQNDAALTMRVHQLHMLQQVTRGIASTLKPDELLQMIPEYAIELANGVAAAVYRCDNGEVGDPVSFHPENRSTALERYARDLAIEVFRTKIASGIQPRPMLPVVLYGIPLVTRHSILGALVVTVERRTDPSEDALNLLQAYADSAALALENAELYDQTRRGYATTSALLQEMHHRVRNNLQIVAALLSMQARQGEDEGWGVPLRQAVARVQSIASIHDLLSGDDIALTTLAAVVRTVVDEASVNAIPPQKSIHFDIDVDAIRLSSRQAMILALLINECITNAVVHAFDDRDEGTISITASEEAGTATLVVADDGIGLSSTPAQDRISGLGTRIARTLAESDLNGEFFLEPGHDVGTRAVVRFPLSTEASSA
ncbi:MAG: GAF domain-containing protein [Chloroflexota bacterium]